MVHLTALSANFYESSGRDNACLAFADNGFQDLAEIQATGHRVLATRFASGRGGGAPAASEADLNILLPQIRRFENDNRLAINFNTALSGYPLAVSAAYGQGTFSVLAIPDDFADLYRLPQSVLNQVRALLGRDVFVSLDAPAHVSLFAYDNRTFIVQNFQPQPVSARVSVVHATRLHDLLTGQTLAAAQGGDGRGGGRGGRGGFGGGGPAFDVAVPAHSFRVFQAE